MKPGCIHIGALLLLTVLCARGQGTFFYDQQSSLNETPPPYGSGGAMQAAIPPWGQSFTPTLSSIGFIRLMFDDGNVDDGLGATIYLNLRSGSTSGSIIGTTSSATMQNAFAGATTFAFPGAIPLAAGTTYYFEPVLQSGGTWNIQDGPYNYPGGSVFSGGSPVTASDLWFREGIIVPEPSSPALLIIGGCTFLWFRRKNHSQVAEKR